MSAGAAVVSGSGSQEIKKPVSDSKSELQAKKAAHAKQLASQQPNKSGASKSKKGAVREILPKAGLVYSEKGNLSEVLCKPKIMPIKSITLEKIEQMERDARTNAAAASVDAATAAGGSQNRFVDRKDEKELPPRPK